jgi:hypothetical protein
MPTKTLLKDLMSPDLVLVIIKLLYISSFNILGY